MLYHPYSYLITIDENLIPQQRIRVLSYSCLLLTKVLFETSFQSFQYNTEGRRLSNYAIKLILCSHYRPRCKGLCQNKKHEFDKYTKGGHFCAAHILKSSINALPWCEIDSFKWKSSIKRYSTLQDKHQLYVFTVVKTFNRRYLFYL